MENSDLEIINKYRNSGEYIPLRETAGWGTYSERSKGNVRSQKKFGFTTRPNADLHAGMTLFWHKSS